jgi:hypothetical protein
VAAGSAHSLAVTRDGALYAWGWNSAGQLGHPPGPPPAELQPEPESEPEPELEPELEEGKWRDLKSMVVGPADLGAISRAALQAASPAQPTEDIGVGSGKEHGEADAKEEHDEQELEAAELEKEEIAEVEAEADAEAQWQRQRQRQKQRRSRRLVGCQSGRKGSRRSSACCRGGWSRSPAHASWPPTRGCHTRSR